MCSKNSTQLDPISFKLKISSDVVLNWPADDRTRPKNIAKCNLILIIASRLDVFCVLTVRDKIIIIIIIIIISSGYYYWQWLFYMYTKYDICY